MMAGRRRALQAAAALGAWPLMPRAATAAEPRPIVWPAEVPLVGAPPLTHADLSGHDVVLGFSSATCAYCLRQDAHLQRLHQQAGTSLLVLGVSTDDSDDAVTTLARQRGWTYRWTRAHRALAALFDARRVLPRTYLVAKGGTLLRAIPGEMFEADVLELADIARSPR